MSLIKKGIRAVKKAIKGVVKFVKKYWREIVVVAAVVFTAGVATVGAGAFMTSMSAAQGFGGFMSTIGSTMYAGATAALGSIGIGGGAAGSVAASAGVTGYGLGAGMGLGGGYGLGVAGKAAAAAAASSPLSGIAPLMSSAGMPSAGAGLAVNPATGQAIAPTTAKMFGAANAASAAPAANIPFAANQASNASKVGGFLNNDLTKAALVTTGGQMLSGYAAAKASEEDDPKGFWGVDLSGKGEDVPYAQNQVYAAPQQQQQSPVGAQAPNAPLTPQQVYEMNQFGRRGLMDPWAPPGGYTA